MLAGRMRAMAALVLAVALAGLLLQPVAVVRVTTADGDPIACRRVAAGAPVTLVFTHSMYGGEVRETWRVDGDALARVRIETDNAAAAEYYATDGAVERAGNGFVVVTPPLRLGELPFRIDEIGNHRLRVGDEEVALAELVDGSEGAVLSAALVPLIARMIDGDAGCVP